MPETAPNGTSYFLHVLLLLHMLKCCNQYLSRLQKVTPGKFYALWPDIERINSPMLREAALAIDKALAAAQIFRCSTADGVTRRRLEELHQLSGSDDAELKTALVADGFAIADPPLPGPILSGAVTGGIKVLRVTAALLRDRWLRTERKDWSLKEAPFPALRRRDWLEFVTRFMISDNPKLQLKGLPLALLANGNGSAFGYSLGNTIFVAGEVERAIFRTCPHWFIDPDYQDATGLTAQAKAQFEEMTSSNLIRNLHVVLPKVGVGRSSRVEFRRRESSKR